MRYAAVIAAAGLSSRMHEFKPMLCVGEQTMIQRIIAGFRSAGVGEIVVVTGYKSAVLKKHLEPLGVTICENEEFAKTKMFDSVCMGIRALSEDYDRVFITPADVPLVQTETIRAMMERDGGIVCPRCSGEQGHPIMITRMFLSRILRYHGENGLRGAIESSGGTIHYVDVDDAGVLMDADTPEDIKQLRRRELIRKGSGQLQPSVQVQLYCGDALLNPEIAQLMEMIDHMESIQSACGCVHMSYSKAWRIIKRNEQELGYPLVESVSGGTGGGKSRLTGRGKRLLAAYQEYQKRVQDIAAQLFEEMVDEDVKLVLRGADE